MSEDFWYITKLDVEAQAGNPVIDFAVLAQHCKNGEVQPDQEARTYAMPLAQAQTIATALLEAIRKAQNSAPGGSGLLN
jgi:hypothetical protein